MAKPFNCLLCTLAKSLVTAQNFGQALPLLATHCSQQPGQLSSAIINHTSLVMIQTFGRIF
jgi:hypothetical protein